MADYVMPYMPELWKKSPDTYDVSYHVYLTIIRNRDLSNFNNTPCYLHTIFTW